jgi:serine phosphatase RsbU (regulator of sigma subunit)
MNHIHRGLKFVILLAIILFPPYPAIIKGAITKIPQAYTVADQSGGLSETFLKQKIADSKSEITSSPGPGQTALAYKSIGSAYQLLNQFDSAVYYYKNGISIAKSNQLDTIYSSIAYDLGLALSTIGNYQEAIKYAFSGLEIDKKSNNLQHISSSLNGIAIIYLRWDVYDKALEYQLESIKISEKAHDQKEIANGNYNLGNIYNKLGKTEQGLKYLNLAREKYQELLKSDTTNFDYRQGLSEALYSCGGIYLGRNELDRAILEYNKSLAIKYKTLDKLGISNIYNQLGTIYVLQEKYPLAIRSFFQSLQYKTQINDPKGIAIAFFNIANVYYRKNEISKSEIFLQKCIETAESVHEKETLKEAYLLLSEISEIKNNKENAFEYYKLYTAYSDSVMNENTTKIVEELSVKYETDRKEKENQILSLTIKKQKTLAFLLSGIIILVLIIVIILYILYRSKQKTNTIISSKNDLLKEQNIKIVNQNKIIESKNRNLTDSIVYAQKIQESLLTKTSELNKTLADAFILLKPKDIVSGDFYWFGKTGNKFIFSAIDCTGHGVPGAFMSMLGNSFLENIIYKDGITSPDKILDELNKSVQTSLKQAETNNQDGMDMAICTIDLATGTVEYSGAKNPLIYIQNQELTTIKGDRYPIGRSLYESVKFTKHTIKPKSPTCFYMFSDGYVDQFGGPGNSKFKIPNFRALLHKIHEKPMAEQQTLLEETLEEWKNGQEQIDDILVVGFKIG